MSCHAPPCAGMGARGSGMLWVACGGMTLARHGMACQCMARHALACPDANFWNVLKLSAVFECNSIPKRAPTL
jgi:hypothetical protein